MERFRAIVVSCGVGIALAIGCSSTSGDAPICGTSGPRQCLDQEPCAGDADCASGSCVTGACKMPIAPICAADAKNIKPGEKLCDGQKCVGADQCVSADCTNNTCAPSPSKKCGVGKPDPCANGEACQQDADCATDYCAGVCGATAADVHADGRRNGGETGIDCGGTALPDKTCPGGEPCKTGDDCASTCTAGVCDAPSDSDGKKNQGESDIDCGGANAPKCALGKACTANSDCILLACTAKVCVKPTSSDGLVNGGETDVDCGGAGVTEGAFTYTAPRCKEGKGCAAGGDCVTGACSPALKCSLPSCATAETAGITSCGKGETGDGAAVHDSCCKSLVLPTLTTRRLDKYGITAGRYRSFITNAGPNIRGFVTTYVAAHPTSQLAKLVGMNAALTSLYPAVDRFDNMSLTAHLSTDIDNYNGIRGCYNGAGSYSANTYWQDATHLADFGIPPRSLARSISDEKSLNCAMPIMFAAFCAWDGGELATLADFHDAWDSTPGQAYPWGTTDLNRPNYNWCNGTYQNGGFLCQCDGVHNACNFSTNGEVGVFYEFPIGTDRSLDNEPLIAAPGRFVKDATALKSGGESWYDLFANMAEYTGDFVASTDDFCDLSAGPIAGKTTCTRQDPSTTPATTKGPGTLYTNIPRVGVIGQTWEGHQYGRGVPSAIWATFQYGKFGARCARPLP